MNRLKGLSVLLLTAFCFCAWTTAGVAEEHANIHGKLKGPFETPYDVTRKCLTCHQDAAKDVMKTEHWNWLQKQRINGKEIMYGKKVAMTNFAITVDGNWPQCTSCHIGYGWESAGYDFKEQSNVDCLVCHDTTGTYKKAKNGAGLPRGFAGEKAERHPVDLLFVAQNVGKPQKKNCGACHFAGCGAAHVRHRALDPSFKDPSLDIDVHMSKAGAGMECQKCHFSHAKHNIMGHFEEIHREGIERIYVPGCVECHSATPHKLTILNSHFNAVGCPTCHIPSYAREYATKTNWNWSPETKEEIKKQQLQQHTPVKKLGTFTYEKNLIPSYEWYNGNDTAYLRGDKIDPTKVVRLNGPVGNVNDKNAKIFPYKTHRATQIFDNKYNYLVTPLLSRKGDTAFWKTYDWNAAAKKGMAAIGLPYSGSYGFVNTITYWRINHGVVPADQALDCLDCHGSRGRMNWKYLGYEGDPWEITGLSIKRQKHHVKK
ncbi:MAG: tetrathionate reductase family octaheme c-type cytochrome [Desulfobacterales bacterium]|nr:tetrathionate reductase family octaheme c-type cytochrome [Desulfobacterales bacterium]